MSYDHFLDCEIDKDAKNHLQEEYVSDWRKYEPDPEDMVGMGRRKRVVLTEEWNRYKKNGDIRNRGGIKMEKLWRISERVPHIGEIKYYIQFAKTKQEAEAEAKIKSVWEDTEFEAKEKKNGKIQNRNHGIIR